MFGIDDDHGGVFACQGLQGESFLVKKYRCRENWRNIGRDGVDMCVVFERQVEMVGCL